MDQNQDYTIEQNPTMQEPRIKLSRVRLHTGLIAFAVVLVILLTSVAQVIVHGVLLANFPAITENDWYMWALSSLPMYLVGMPLAYLLLRALPTRAPQKRRFNPFTWFGFLCLCFAVSFASNYIGQYISSWFSVLTGIKIENELGQMTGMTPFGINLLFVGILAPIFEELFYRKAVIDRLRRYGDLPAILLSGLIFGLVHGNLNQMFYATAVGILLSFIYVRTGSVLYTISIHAAFNMIGGVYTTELLRRLGDSLTPAEGDTVGEAMLAAYSIFVVVSLVVGLIFFLVNIKRFRRSLMPGEYTLDFDDWMRVLFINPGMWLFVGTVVLLVVTSLLT